MVNQISRRGFLKRVGGGIGACAVSPMLMPLNDSLAQSLPSTQISNIIMIFLPGGLDSLSSVDVPVEEIMLPYRGAITVSNSQRIEVGTDAIGQSVGVSNLLPSIAGEIQLGNGVLVRNVGNPALNASGSHHLATLRALTNGAGEGLLSAAAYYAEQLYGDAQPIYAAKLGPADAGCSGSGFVMPSKSFNEFPNRQHASALPGLMEAVHGTFLESLQLPTKPYAARVYESNRKARAAIDYLADSIGSVEVDAEFSQSNFSQGCREAYKNALAGELKVVRLHQGSGYDTHSGQVQNHAANLANLEEGTGELILALKNTSSPRSNGSLYDETLILISSEFSRTTVANGGADSGTPHGNTGTMVALSGSLNPSLGPAVGVHNNLAVPPFPPVLFDMHAVHAAAFDSLFGPGSGQQICPNVNPAFTFNHSLIV